MGPAMTASGTGGAVDPADFMAICDLKYRYAAGIDLRDWALYRSIFDDRVYIDFSSYNGRPASNMSADEWVAGVQPLFTGLAATQHSMTNPRVEVAGNRATLRMYMQAEHVLDHDDPSAWFAIGGFYTDEAVRIANGRSADDQSSHRWKLSSVTLTVWWRRGRPEIMAQASERGRRSPG
jgi:hypothetical protein